MTDSSTTVVIDSTFDPETVADRAGVAHAERTYTHESTDHCEADAAGRVVVGVTDDRGKVLLLVDHEHSVPMLPNAVVDTDEAWIPAARSAVTDTTGLDVTVGEPVAIRHVEHTTEDSDIPHNETSHVLFEASNQRHDTEPVTPDDSPFEAGWFDSLPVEIPEDKPVHGDVIDDIGSFIDIDDHE